MFASEICLRLFWHLARAAALRTFWTAGRSRPIRIAMIAITTSSSISVNPGRLRIGRPPEKAPSSDGHYAAARRALQASAGATQAPAPGGPAARAGRAHLDHLVARPGAAAIDERPVQRLPGGEVLPMHHEHAGPAGGQPADPLAQVAAAG